MRWNELPEKVDPILSELCTNTTNLLSKEDKNQAVSRKFGGECLIDSPHEGQGRGERGLIANDDRDDGVPREAGPL